MVSAQAQNSKISDLPHVLVVDDDSRIRSLLSRYLSENGFVAVTAADAAAASAILKNFEFDVMIVDVMMPGESGLSFTRSLGADNKIPVLLLTALGEASDRIAGFEAGADDYLPKPFEPQELVLRLNAILRRTAAQRPQKSRALKIGRWRFDPDIAELQDGLERIMLTSTESALITSLALYKGQAVSREDLARHCGFNAGERTIDVQVTRLRRKLEEDVRMPRVLQTVRGKGYLLRFEEL